MGGATRRELPDFQQAVVANNANPEAVLLPSVLGRDLGDNTRTYIPAVREEKLSADDNMQVARVPAPAPAVLGRDLGDNTRTHLPGVYRAYKDGAMEYDADVDADKTHRSRGR